MLKTGVSLTKIKEALEKELFSATINLTDVVRDQLFPPVYSPLDHLLDLTEGRSADFKDYATESIPNVLPSGPEGEVDQPVNLAEEIAADPPSRPRKGARRSSDFPPPSGSVAKLFSS
jgi:hypothetical protein